MIIYDDFDLGGVTYHYIHSDSRFRLQREDGVKVGEALELPGAHTYTETDEKIGEKQDYEKAMKIILGQEE